jgi:streptogramin lyase
MSAALIVTALVSNPGPASSAPALTFTPYSNTGVVTPRGLAARGKYVWVTDIGNDGAGARVVRIDAATGDKRTVASKYGAFLSYVAASRRYAWVMDFRLGNETYSLLRINATNLAVRRISLSHADIAGISYSQGPILLAGDFVWIPGARGILRVNTTTLKVSTITSPLIFGSLQGGAVDAHYLWLNGPSGNGHLQTFFVRVSLATGDVTKVNFPGVKGGYPIGDDGTNLWVMDTKGIQRINPTTGEVATVVVPKEAEITLPQDMPSAVADGGIYFCAGLAHHSVVVRITITSGLATVLSSPLLYQSRFVASANGVAWIVNTPLGFARPVKQPILVRVN